MSCATSIITAKLTAREHAELGPVVEFFHAYQHTEQDIATAREMLSDPR